MQSNTIYRPRSQLQRRYPANRFQRPQYPPQNPPPALSNPYMPNKEPEKTNLPLILGIIIIISFLIILILFIIFFRNQSQTITEDELLDGKTIVVNGELIIKAATDNTYSLKVNDINTNDVSLTIIGSDSSQADIEKTISIGQESIIKNSGYNISIKLEDIKNNKPKLTIKKIKQNNNINKTINSTTVNNPYNITINIKTPENSTNNSSINSSINSTLNSTINTTINYSTNITNSTYIDNQTCSQKPGLICQTGYYCNGTINTSSDSSNCCLGSCQINP